MRPTCDTAHELKVMQALFRAVDPDPRPAGIFPPRIRRHAPDLWEIHGQNFWLAARLYRLPTVECLVIAYWPQNPLAVQQLKDTLQQKCSFRRLPLAVIERHGELIKAVTGYTVASKGFTHWWHD